MHDPQEQPELTSDHHPLITLGIMTAGTQLGSALIKKMAKRHLVLFAMGVTVGIYSYKNRKEILAETRYFTKQGKKLLSKKTKDR